MVKSNHETTYHEFHESEQKEKLARFEIERTDALNEFVMQVQKVQEFITHDTVVTARDMRQIEEHLSRLTLPWSNPNCIRMREIEDNSVIKNAIKNTWRIGENILDYYLDEFDDLLFLTKETADVLVDQFNDELEFNNLVQLPYDISVILSKVHGALSLNSLTHISPEVARALSAHKGGGLLLNGLRELSADAACSLAQRKDALNFAGLKHISDDTADALSKHKGDFIDLSGLESLSDKAAKYFARYSGEVDLMGLKTISDTTAKTLSGGRGTYIVSPAIRSSIDEKYIGQNNQSSHLFIEEED